MNTEELMKQQREIEVMQEKYKKFVGEQKIGVSDGNSSQGNFSESNLGKKLESGRVITIKSNKYYDAKEGVMKKQNYNYN